MFLALDYLQDKQKQINPNPIDVTFFLEKEKEMFIHVCFGKKNNEFEKKLKFQKMK